jgi:hypothetical protein
MKKLVIVACFGLIGVAALFLISCEVGPVSNDDLKVSPESIGLYKNESAEFTASGGYHYTWSLSDSTKGILSTTNGSTTRYTSRYDPGEDSSTNSVFVQILTVSSTIPGSANPGGGTASNTTSYVGTAQARIEHFATVTNSSTTSSSTAISISPTSASLVNNSAVAFTASGGNSNYVWSLSEIVSPNVTLTIVTNSTTMATVYCTSTLATNQTVSEILYVFDSNGLSTSASLSITK